MRRKEREITDQNKIREIIDQSKILHLGLMDDGYPYIVPLHYGYEYREDKILFYMHGAKEGHKLDLLRRNPHVCVEVECDVEPIPGGEVPCRYGSAYASVIGRGNGEIVEKVEDKIHGLKLLMKNQTGRDFDITEKMASSVSVIRVEIDEYSAKGNIM